MFFCKIQNNLFSKSIGLSVAESFLSASLAEAQLCVARGSAAVLSNKRSSAALASLRLVSVDLWNAAFAGRKKSQKFAFSFSTGGSARSSAQMPTCSGKKCLHSLQQCRSVKHSGQLLWRLMGRGISARSRPQFQQTTVLMNSTAANIGPLRLSWRCTMKACLQRMR